MIEYFVDVAKECINIGNFNSLMSIIGMYSLIKNLLLKGFNLLNIVQLNDVIKIIFYQHTTL